MNETKYWIWLSMIFGVANRRIWEAMRLFGSVREAYDVLSSGSIDLRLSETERKNIASVPLERAENFIEECRENGIETVGCGDKAYPPQLRNIFDPPAVLYYQGDLSCVIGTRTVTAVGARKSSDYSLRACTEVCGDLSRSGAVIVSGFAVGMDITAHLAAADIGRPTACVLGCGIDYDYPTGNVQFRKRILESGGVFISEYPPGTPPHSGNFPKRNRILSALGRVTIVFEASSKSGSLITANLAANQGRTVFCLPPADIFSSRFSGNAMLLRDGAELLLDYHDVLGCFKQSGGIERVVRSELLSGVSYFGVGELLPKKERKAKDTASAFTAAAKSAVPEKAEELHTAEKVEEIEELPEQFSGYSELEDHQKRILDAMNGETLPVDIIAERLGMELSELMTELTELELGGAVDSLPGNIYRSNQKT